MFFSHINVSLLNPSAYLNFKDHGVNCRAIKRGEMRSLAVLDRDEGLRTEPTHL